MVNLEIGTSVESPYSDLQDGHIHALARLRQIRETARDDDLLELSPMLIVGLATCLEWFARATIKRLIDYAPDLINGEARLLRDVKLNYSMILRTHKNQFSIGDLIALSRNFSSFDDIQETLFDLVGKPKTPLYMKLSLMLDRGRLKNKSAVTTLNKMFRDRHELVHGSPRHMMFIDERVPFISQRDLLVYCEHIENFIRQFEKFLRRAIPSYWDRSTMEMVMSQGDRLQTTDDRIAQLAAAIEKRLDPETVDEFRAAQKAWDEWRQSEAEFQTYIWRGGTFRNVARLGEATSIGNQRIRQLEFVLRSL